MQTLSPDSYNAIPSSSTVFYMLRRCLRMCLGPLVPVFGTSCL
ncbi:hypothetical protein L798_04917 [Zootermopsis nevadensis]|uniref:Uncharacterized protein n=1 Tax=Zootermopsis nevadensis TaxID=136037 RepID=A0A067RLE5_ZOONE|nr:hypothetical protein L798_04917 [Zootermopsis nevadensis]